MTHFETYKLKWVEFQADPAADPRFPKWMHFAGLYVWWNSACNSCAYVGESLSVRLRLMEHFQIRDGGFCFHGHPVNPPLLYVAPLTGHIERLDIEWRIIQEHHPILNKETRRRTISKRKG